MKLVGRVSSATDAGRGSRRACALCLAKIGVDMVVNDINLESAKEYNEKLKDKYL